MARLLRRGTRGVYAILLQNVRRGRASCDEALRFRPLVLRDLGCEGALIFHDEEEDEGAPIFHGGLLLCGTASSSTNSCGGTSSSTNSSSDAAWVSTA